MNTVEDRMREAFAHVTVPDVPVPEIQALQRRARRHRYNQASAALGSVAVVVMCVLGGMSFTTRGDGATNSSDIQRIKASVPGAGDNQWLVNQQTLGGKTYQTASFLQYGHPCIVSTLTATGPNESLGVGGGAVPQGALRGQWCPTSGWPVGEVADESSYTATFGGGGAVEISGRVPMSARTVVVHVDDAAVTVPAVATPTSSAERFFSAYLKVPTGRSVPVTPIIAVYDKSGRSVTAPHPRNDVQSGTQVSHVAGLPDNQRSFVTTTSGMKAIVYRTGSTPCVALAVHGVLRSHTCAADAPQSGRPLISAVVPGLGRMTLGDAPAWADQLQISGPANYDQVTLTKATGIDDRSFWLTRAPHPNSRNVIATCVIGDNCTVVQKWIAPTAA